LLVFEGLRGPLFFVQHLLLTCGRGTNAQQVAGLQGS